MFVLVQLDGQVQPVKRVSPSILEKDMIIDINHLAICSPSCVNGASCVSEEISWRIFPFILCNRLHLILVSVILSIGMDLYVKYVSFLVYPKESSENVTEFF